MAWCEREPLHLSAVEMLRSRGLNVASPPYFQTGGVGAHITLLQEEEGQLVHKQVGVHITLLQEEEGQLVHKQVGHISPYYRRSIGS
jgi:hypothetical protein